MKALIILLLKQQQEVVAANFDFALLKYE